MSASRPSAVLAVIATAVVAATVVTAVVILGPPSAQRQRKMDRVRVMDLVNVAASVDGYYRLHKALPADLGALAREPGYRIARRDPQTGAPYGYQILAATEYRLCADFATDSATATPDFEIAYVSVEWVHGQGHRCFDRHADKRIQ